MPGLPVTVRMFTQRLSSTPRGARLARRLVAQELDMWGYAYAGEVNDTVALVAAELASNAVRHGRVPGRDFRVRLTEDERGVLRVAVSDQRGDRLPRGGGYGLLLVGALAARWGVESAAPGKTVWAEVAGNRALAAPGDDSSPA